jgi:mycothiol synthase
LEAEEFLVSRVRVAETERDLETYVRIWNAITPDQPASLEQQRERKGRDPRRLHLLAERDDTPVGCGFAGPSDSPGRGFLAPRVLPSARRGGIGTALLWQLVAHLGGLGYGTASSHVDGRDPGSLAFATRNGFAEVDRQVEQVKVVGDEAPADVPEGIRFLTVAERPDLLEAAYDLAVEGFADMATAAQVTISLDDWLRDEATVPEGSFIALAGDEIVGYSGLCRRHDGVFEDGLTVVRRSWRRHRLATALKQAELAWAGANGVEEIVTWTQRDNAGMRAVNERLGYVYRSITVEVCAALPLTMSASHARPCARPTTARRPDRN